MSDLMDQMLLLKNLQKLLAIVKPLQILNSERNVALELFELIKSLIGEVLWRWLVVLHALQIADDLLGVCLLLVNDAFQHVKLLIDFLVDLILKAFLIQYLELHILALSKIIDALLLNLL